MKYEKLAESILALLNGYAYKYKMYKGIDGKRTSNPYDARYFYVEEPNLMFIIDETSNTLTVHKAYIKFSSFKEIHKAIRDVARRYFINLEIRDYNKGFAPKDFSPVQMKKEHQIDQLRESQTKKRVEIIESCGNIIEVNDLREQVSLTLNGETKMFLPYRKDEVLPRIVNESLRTGELSKDKVFKLYDIHEKMMKIQRKVKFGNATPAEVKLLEQFKDVF